MSQKNMGRRTAIQVKFNNVDISENINDNLISISYTDESEGAADDLKIVIHDRDGIWVRDWLKKELEQRDQANADIASGNYGGTSSQGNSGAGRYTVTAKIGLNVRDIPSTDGNRIGGIAYGDTVFVSEISDGWAKITYSGRTGFVFAQYLKANGSGTASGNSENWEIGDEVTVNGRAQYTSYGEGKPGVILTNYKGHIDRLNLKSGVPYPIHVDDIGWFAESDVTSNGSMSQSMDGSQTSNAKYTKINVVISALNVDGEGTDRVLNCGTFELDSVKFSAPPKKIEMNATSLSYESSIRKVKKTRSWTNTNLKGIAGDIASAGGYDLMYLSSYVPKYSGILQNAISDIEFLSRRCRAAGLKLKVTDGILVIFDSKDRDSENAVRTFRMDDGTYESISLESTLSLTAYSSCHVDYEDDEGNTYEATFTPPTGYSEGEVLEVTEQVGSNAEALELAKRRLRAENKGEVTGRIKLPGDPRLTAGTNIRLRGFGDFDGKYSIEKATHKVPGYTTDIEIAKVVEGY